MADVADDHFALVDADANVQRHAVGLGLPLRVELDEGGAHGEGGADGAAGIVFGAFTEDIPRPRP